MVPRILPDGYVGVRIGAVRWLDGNSSSGRDESPSVCVDTLKTVVRELGP